MKSTVLVSQNKKNMVVNPALIHIDDRNLAEYKLCALGNDGKSIELGRYKFGNRVQNVFDSIAYAILDGKDVFYLPEE